MSTPPPDSPPGTPDDWEADPGADGGEGLHAFDRQPAPLPWAIRPDAAHLAIAELVALRVAGATDSPLALAAAEALRDPLLGRDRRRKVAVRLARLGPDDAADDALEIAAGIASPTGRLWMAMRAIRAFAVAVPDADLTHGARRARRLATVYFGRALRDSDAGWVDLPRAPDLLTNLVIEMLGRTGVPALDGPGGDGPEVPGGESGEAAAERARIQRRDPWAVMRAAPDEPVDWENVGGAVKAAPEVSIEEATAPRPPATQGSATQVVTQVAGRDAANDAGPPVVRPEWTGPRARPLLEQIAADGPEGKTVRRTWRVLEAELPLLGTADPDLDSLEAESPWLAPAITRLRRMLALQRLSGRGWFRMKPILLVGPAGTGKTRLARRIAEVAGVPMRTIPCGASTDARMLIGTARGWHSTQPCFPLVAMARSGCANPVIYVDELDKGARFSPNGSVAQGLLPYLEAETAARWTDECLLAQADVSTVSWIASANDLKPIPQVLQSRFAVIEVPAPPADAFDGALRQVLAEIAADYEVPDGGLPEIEPELVEALRAGFAMKKISLRRLREEAESAIGDLLLRRPRN